jgi:hypothetical protein
VFTGEDVADAVMEEGEGGVGAACVGGGGGPAPKKFFFLHTIIVKFFFVFGEEEQNNTIKRCKRGGSTGEGARMYPRQPVP